MNSYKYFSKNKLSYILNNERRYAPQIISDLKAYCRVYEIDIEKVKSKREFWDLLNQDRLSRELQSDRLTITKKRTAKVSDFRINLFWLFIMIALLCIGTYRLFSFQSLDLIEKISLAVGVPIVTLLLIGQYGKIKELKKSLDIQTGIELFPARETNVLKNRNLELSTKIEEVKLIWLKDQNEDNPEIALSLLFINGDTYEVDKSRDLFELFDTFSQIVQFTNAKFSVVQL